MPRSVFLCPVPVNCDVKEIPIYFCKRNAICAADSRFPRTRPQSPRSQRTLTAGSSDSCYSRRSQLSSAPITLFSLAAWTALHTKAKRHEYSHPARGKHGDSCGSKSLDETPERAFGEGRLRTRHPVATPS
ncbi:hypothetical protein JNUCC1_00342 [Lentibacillus sp. JNUCC-1]|nr:hypothetical protein [Lentibacillus sp. JNUCC-1]